MPKTTNYTRHHGWGGKERVAMTLRVPKKLHKKITRAALVREMTINDLMVTIMEMLTTPAE